MSKRLKDYPDPVEVVKKHGADALRLYLVNSPVVRAESLRFKESVCVCGRGKWEMFVKNILPKLFVSIYLLVKFYFIMPVM